MLVVVKDERQVGRSFAGIKRPAEVLNEKMRVASCQFKGGGLLFLIPLGPEHDLRSQL
jgi:hypothetical protein